MHHTWRSRARGERDQKLGITTGEHVRPWLQAFTLGKPPYGAAEIEAQKTGNVRRGLRRLGAVEPGLEVRAVPAGAREDAGVAEEAVSW